MRMTIIVGLLFAFGGLFPLAGCASVAQSPPPAVRPTEAGVTPTQRPPHEAVAVVRRVEDARVLDDVETLAAFGTRHTLSATEPPERGIGAARRWIKRAFEEAIAIDRNERALSDAEAGVPMPEVFFDTHTIPASPPRVPEPVEIVNVACVIPGVDPDEADRHVYVLAHYDSRASDPVDPESDAPGANDNASGTAVLIELARVLAAEPLEATVVLLATAGEEQGLFGARAHADELAKAGIEVDAVLNNDTVGDPYGPHARDARRGRAARKTIRVFSQGVPPALEEETLARIATLGAESDSAARQVARYTAEVAHWHDLRVKPMLVFRNDRFLRGGDHTAFIRAGYDASVRLTVPYEEYTRQHQDVRIEPTEVEGVNIVYGDVAQAVDAGYLGDVARLNAASVAHLANAPRSPENARLIVADLTTDTTIRWDAAESDDILGYEIVSRRTTSPVWERADFVGDVAEATIDLSKDNWIFGVRAVDVDGYRSLVTYPFPAQE